jgi:hypothetical protein
MSISRSTQTLPAIELDTRELWGSKNARQSVEQSPKDLASQVSQISGRSVHEIDHLIAGLQGVRDKLNTDGDRIHREVQQHTSFSQSIVDLTAIINDAMASVNKPPVRVPDDAA